MVADTTTRPSIHGLFDGLVPGEVVDAYERLLASDGCANSEAESVIGARLMGELTRWGMAHRQLAAFTSASATPAIQGR